MKLLPILLAAGALSYGCAANALELNPYLGAEFKAWGTDNDNRVFNSYPNNYKAGNFFIGSHFHPNFAFEVGYTTSGNRSKVKTWPTTVPAGTGYMGNTAAIIGDGDTTTMKVRMSSWNFNLNGYYSLMDDLDLMGTLGIASVKPRVASTYVDVAPVVINTFSAKGRNSFAYRVGAGLKYMFNHNWGSRAYVNWENNASTKVRVTATSVALPTTVTNFDIKPWNNDVSFSIGLFYGW